MADKNQQLRSPDDEVLVEQDDNTEEVINVCAFPQKFEISGVRYTLKPGQKVRIHRNYATNRQMQVDRDRIPSAVELMTGGNVLPVSHSKVPKHLKEAK